MALWDKKDDANSAPKWLTTAELDDTYFVDNTEAGVAANQAKGLSTPGWNKYTTYTDANGKTRHKAEVLVAMSATALEAGDLGTSGNTDIEDATVADS
jgi:hypothetical protein